MNELSHIIGDYEAFLKQLLQEVEAAGFDFSDFVQMDHICYRVPTVEQYHAKKKELLTVGRLVGEAQVNGRPIATLRFNNAVHFDGWRIDAIELPAQGRGHNGRRTRARRIRPLRLPGRFFTQAQR